mgnify:CR=1 FL=1
MPRVIIEPHPPFDVEAGTSLLDASEDAGFALESDCGGVAACNACRVDVLEGMENLSPEGDEEAPFLDADDQRLGCQACVLGDVRVRPAAGL